MVFFLAVPASGFTGIYTDCSLQGSVFVEACVLFIYFFAFLVTVLDLFYYNQLATAEHRELIGPQQLVEPSLSRA